MAQDTELGGYQIVGRLAVGGMAEVFQARARPGVQRSPGEPDEVVLKRLLPTFRGDGGWVKQFVDEAKLTVRLKHPHIVRTFRCFRAGADYLMVQELVSGRTLGFMQDLLVRSNAVMPQPAATYLVWCLLQALDYLHRGHATEGGATVVHRDVNPSNVLLSVTGDVKLTDFGVAEVQGQLTGEQGALRGTVGYMSPEQVLGENVDHRSDLFSAGILMWELFANRKLYDAYTEADLMVQARNAKVPLLTTVMEGVPSYAAQIARKALFADRTLRFQSAAEFAKALELLAQRNGWPLSVEALRPLLGGG